MKRPWIFISLAVCLATASPPSHAADWVGEEYGTTFLQTFDQTVNFAGASRWRLDSSLLASPAIVFSSVTMTPKAELKEGRFTVRPLRLSATTCTPGSIFASALADVTEESFERMMQVATGALPASGSSQGLLRDAFNRTIADMTSDGCYEYSDANETFPGVHGGHEFVYSVDTDSDFAYNISVNGSAGFTISHAPGGIGGSISGSVGGSISFGAGSLPAPGSATILRRHIDLTCPHFLVWNPDRRVCECPEGTRPGTYDRHGRPLSCPAIGREPALPPRCIRRPELCTEVPPRDPCAENPGAEYCIECDFVSTTTVQDDDTIYEESSLDCKSRDPWGVGSDRNGQAVWCLFHNGFCTPPLRR